MVKDPPYTSSVGGGGPWAQDPPIKITFQADIMPRNALARLSPRAPT